MKIVINRLWVIGFMMLLISSFVLISVQIDFAAETTNDTYGKILADYQLITGYNGDLMAEKDISRVEMVAILSKFYESAFKEYMPPTIATFDDVQTSHWGYKYVEFAYKMGITKGKSANIFGASDTVNYNQVSIFLLKSLGFDLKSIEYKTAASEIATVYGLKLLLPKDNNLMLVRGEVFELIDKALLMKDINGALGLEMLKPRPVSKETFIARSEAIINTPVAIYSGGAIFNIYYANGDLYTGEFDGTFPKGYGTLKLADGKLYIGQFEKGMLQGFGILIWPEGDYYEGEWMNSTYTGLGTYSYMDGSYQYGEWLNDILVKPIKEVTPEMIASGTAVATKDFIIEILGTDGLPLKDIALTILDETNDIQYNLITDTKGLITVPKNGDFLILRLSLGFDSSHRFTRSNSRNMATTVGTYKNGGTFELFKK